jgi:hypothetical protein
MRGIVALLLAALFCSSSFAQAPATGKKGGAPPQTTCDAEKKKALLEGWQLGRKEGLNAGLNTGFEKAFNLSSTTLPVAGKQLKIDLFVEDIEGSDSYRLAAAEVVRTRFSDWLVVFPDSPLTLYVAGAGPTRSGTASLYVDVQMTVQHRVVADGGVHLLWGTLLLAQAARLLSGHTVEERTQKLREMTYEVISEFLRKWQEPPKLPKEKSPTSPPK